MIFSLFILATLLMSLTFICLWSLRVFSQICLSEEDAVQARRLPTWLRSVPLFGKRFAEVETILTNLKQSDSDHRTRYKILTENVAAAVVLHQADGTILWCSPFTEVLTGFPLSEIYRDKEGFLLSHIHEDDREMVERSLKIVGIGEPFQCRYRLYHKSGMTLWLDSRTVPILDNSSHEYVALSIMIDVTAHVMNQMRIEERNRDLNEFTYMISHDLKAPIITISGMLAILEESPACTGAPELSEAISYIRKATRRLESLVSGVLELARISTSERNLEPISLQDVLNEVLDDHHLPLEKADAKVTTVQELPVVLGNKTQLYQILSNLIGNAIKYRSDNRPLLISIGTERGASRRKVAITVQDNGRGINPDNLDMIFKPFNRAGEESIEGTGVGLASVKKLVEKLGGTITVESAPDEGTAFTIQLRANP